MSEAEVILYAIASCLVFFWGVVLLILNLIHTKKSKRSGAWMKLAAWFLLPPILGFFAIAAMMDPLGGEPVILILRFIAVSYIFGGIVFLVLEHARKNEPPPS